MTDPNRTIAKAIDTIAQLVNMNDRSIGTIVRLDGKLVRADEKIDNQEYALDTLEAELDVIDDRHNEAIENLNSAYDDLLDQLMEKDTQLASAKADTAATEVALMELVTDLEEHKVTISNLQGELAKYVMTESALRGELESVRLDLHLALETTTPQAQVGDEIKTLEEYEALPDGATVSTKDGFSDWHWVKVGGQWQISDDPDYLYPPSHMSGGTRTILSLPATPLEQIHAALGVEGLKAA